MSKIDKLIVAIERERIAVTPGWDSDDETAIAGLFNADVSGETKQDTIAMSRIIALMGDSVALARMRVAVDTTAETDPVRSACVYFLGQLGNGFTDNDVNPNVGELGSMLDKVNGTSGPLLPNPVLNAIRSTTVKAFWEVEGLKAKVSHGEARTALDRIG